MRKKAPLSDREKAVVATGPPGACWAVLTDRCKTFLDLHVPDNPDPFKESVQSLLLKPRRDNLFRLLRIGDGTGYDEVYVEFEDGTQNWIDLIDLKIVSGSIRHVPKRGRIHMGRTSLMGAIAHGIRTGRAFRGR